MGGYATPADLYRADELLRGFDPQDPVGYTRTYDFEMFRQYVRDGGPTPKSLSVQRDQAEHDAHIADGLRRFLKPAPRLVGFMGGHKLGRTEPAYGLVARLARALTREHFLPVSGGGPGAMEATHLGAMFANAPDGQLDDAIAYLKERPNLPKDLNDILDGQGNIAPGREAAVKEAHEWFKRAWDVFRAAPKNPGTSLAIPTWFYGQEPTCPFATHYAKYFQNGIREETLVTETRAGIIYARGGGGTVREIFQDAEQNYYAKSAREFTPMIFFDPDKYWEQDPVFDTTGAVTKYGIKLDIMLHQFFKFGRANRPDREADERVWSKKVVFTTDFREIARILSEHAPVAQRNLEYLVEAQPTKIALAAWSRGTA